MKVVYLTEEEFQERATREGIFKDAVEGRASETERVFPRPKIRWGRAVFNVLSSLAAASGLSVGAYFLSPPEAALSVSLSVGFGSLALYGALRLKSILLWLIDFYRATAKESTRARCVFEPTCSEYARTAILRFGAWKGAYLAFRRLRRCHYPNGGFDPVPEKRRGK